MKKFLTLSVISLLIAGAVITSCSDDKTDGPAPIVTEGDGNVQLKLSNALPGLRAYNGEEPAIAGETELASTVSVYVYDESGVLDYQNPALPVNSSGLTNTFKVSEGMKYFYIFSNGQTSTVSSGSSWDELENQVARVTFQNNRPTPIADEGSMSIGTLWRIGDDTHALCNKFDVQPAGSVAQPVRAPISIGRATAKVRLTEINKESSPGASPLKGVFSPNPIYRLRSLPERYYVVGHLDESGDYPPTDGLRYISFAHDLPPGTLEVPSTSFLDYFWEGALTPSTTTHYYAVENTTRKMEIPDPLKDGAYLYYGNTTYVQFKITYTPDASELYSPALPPVLSTNSISTGDTFWSAVYRGSRMIFDSEPEGPEFTEIYEYENGEMYYKFPIRDQRETGVDRQCCVIRNHYYEIKVSNIFNLGEPTDKVDPKTPIDETDPDVEVLITVLPWFKVEQEENL